MSDQIPLTIHSDSEIFFKIIVKSTITFKKTLMIDIKATRVALDKNEILNIGWVRTHKIIAKKLTKLTICEVLEKLLDTTRMYCHVEQLILRRNDESLTTSETGNIDSRFLPQNTGECELYTDRMTEMRLFLRTNG